MQKSCFLLISHSKKESINKIYILIHQNPVKVNVCYQRLTKLNRSVLACLKMHYFDFLMEITTHVSFKYGRIYKNLLDLVQEIKPMHCVIVVPDYKILLMNVTSKVLHIL